MKSPDDILGYARTLFDEVGVATQPATGGTIIILGLVSTPERDLDDFAGDGSKILMRGFHRHARGRLEALLRFIRGRGYSAELIGRLGYPLDGRPNLKHLAVAAGLGRQGKNTLLISPRFGPWLRLMAMRTDAPLAATGPGVYSKEENPDCAECDRCVEACPVRVLAPYRLVDTDGCLAAVSGERRGGLAICDRCVVVCPVGERTASR